ncbi:hypothetical protein R6Q57_024493 [Mikania cordata]
MGTHRCIDWGVLGDCGEAERARAILGEDTPWTRLFDLEELPSYRLITVEFLSTFRYRAHQAAVRVDEDAELPPDIEFSLCGQHFEMGGGGDEGLVGPDLRYAVSPATGSGDDDQGSSDQIHPPVHRDDHLRSRPVAGVGDYDRSILSALTPRRLAVQPGTVFCLILRLLLPPSGAWYTVGWHLHHPHCPDQRHGRPPISAATGDRLARPTAAVGAAAALAASGAGGRVTAARGGGASAASTARLPCGAPDRAAQGVAAPYCQTGRRVGPADGTRRATARSSRGSGPVDGRVRAFVTGHSFHRSRSHACTQTTDRPLYRPLEHPDRS